MENDFWLREWHVLPQRNAATTSNKEIHIEPKAMQVLVCLAENAGNVVGKEQLVQSVWEGAFVSDEALAYSIWELRKALGDDARRPRFIQTVSKKGYRLIAPVSRKEAEVAIGRRGSLLTAVVLLAFGLAVSIGFNLGGLRDRLLGEPSPVPIGSLAVLPIENLSGDPEQEYFADGMTEALIAELGHIRGLRVISRTSVMAFKEVRKPLSEIARELDVDAVIEGSVLRSGHRVRITTQLVQVTPERQLWSRSFERELRDVLTIQSEVARAVAREIKVKLTPQEKALLRHARPVEPEAYDAYLKGHYFLGKRTPESLQRGLDNFQRAIEEDPDFASAYAGVAKSHNLLGDYAVVPPTNAYPKAKEAAVRALDIDDNLAEGHAALAWARLVFDYDWAGAETEFRLSIELNPSHATARQWYGEYLVLIGHHNEAVEQIGKARNVDPLSPIISLILGWNFHFSRQYDQAIEQYHRTLELDPGLALAHTCLGRAYMEKGMTSEAITEFQNAIALGGPLGVGVSGFLGNAYARAGKRLEAYKLLDELSRLSTYRNVPPSAMAYIYVGLGEKDQAIQWLERGYELRHYEMTEIKMDPIWDSLRDEPGFQNLLRRMNFPE